ncbi:MAG: ribosome biogenesis GTPase YlqF [Clostridia bacterium]|nr:ribosome biogenesis GTPase YlqF [Clostridia bacterium]MBQ9506930.1 ribosome biogenesis GTPase YlqF [Clostridia bacterium]MBR5424618.1 ribosome biogenesis GTPase YlqF [Clostridia bacterium]
MEITEKEKNQQNISANINWFPGHMAKTRRQIKESLKLVDAVVELRDARIPVSSTNPELNELIGNKPKIILLNKADLADEAATRRWLAYYKAQGVPAVPADARSGKGLGQLRAVINEVLADKIKSNAEKGMAGKALRLMVVGIPNTGKSSFINRMAKSSKAKVEDRAGVTRHNKWYVIDGGLELLDTPGVLWPKFEDPEVGCRLAFTGGIKDDILDIEELAVKLTEILAKDYPARLTERYKVKDFEGLSPYEVLEMIGRKRGMLISGGEVDTLRASQMLLDELRGGKLGKITFEMPE